MKLVPFPALPPFCCGKCGATEGTRDYWIDTDIDCEVPSHADGRVYICSACMLNFGEVDPQLVSRAESDKLLSYQNDFVLKALETEKAWEQVKQCFLDIGIDLQKVWELSGFGRNKLIDASPKPYLTTGRDNSTVESDNLPASSSESDPFSLLTID